MSKYLCSMAFQNLPSCVNIERDRRKRLSEVIARPLDRVNVLGDDRHYGHTGYVLRQLIRVLVHAVDSKFALRCVNALSWAQDGDLLLSGGDDRTVRIWKMDTSNTQQEYPFVSRCVIRTGHQANIFSAQMLPHSSRMYVYL